MFGFFHKKRQLNSIYVARIVMVANGFFGLYWKSDPPYNVSYSDNLGATVQHL